MPTSARPLAVWCGVALLAVGCSQTLGGHAVRSLPGIDDDSQRHLFERFWRGPQGSSSGSGLGLAIAGEMAQRMGGEIAVHSEEGHTSFALRLPSDSLSSGDGDR